MSLISGQELTKKLCQDFIQIPSLPGQEKDIATFVEKTMKKLAFDRVEIDDFGNVLGYIKGKSLGKKILLDSHLDTVPAEKKDWVLDPFSGKIDDNKIYGRGASDMKGSLAAMIVAAHVFAETTAKDFAGEIIVSATVLEEFLEGVAARRISQKVEPDFVIIGEATDLAINIGQRGRAEILIEVRGKSAHSAKPDYGKNAVYEACKIIEALRKMPLNNDPLLGDNILELTDIKSDPYPGTSVVPQSCRMTFDRRLIRGENQDNILDFIHKQLDEIAHLDYSVSIGELEKNSWTNASLFSKLFFPPWLIEKEHYLVQKSLQGLQKAGLEMKTDYYSFCTNASHYAGEAKIPTIGFGPSQENLAHIADEYIEIDELIKAYRGYFYILDSLLNI